MAMISPFFVIVLFFSSPYVFTNMLVVQASDSLIMQTCQNTKAAATCMACLNSGAQNDIISSLKIASALMECGNNQAVSLIGIIPKLIAPGPLEGLFKAYVGCGNSLLSAQDSLTSANTKLKGGDYIGADIDLLTAIQRASGCRRQFASWWGTTYGVPPTVKNQVDKMEELFDAAKSVIGDLKRA